MSRWRWLLLGVAVLLFAVSILLALAGVPSAISGPGDVFANLGTNLVTTLGIALLAYAWFYLWTSYYATRRIRRQARERPERLFPGPARVGKAKDLFGRDDLIEEIADNLKEDFRTGPQVIVGDTGSGKTSLLLGLADHFAKRDVFPIVISLAGTDERLDFAELAQDRFREHVDPYVRTADDSDKLWRLMSRRGELVVLADDLDRAEVPGLVADPYKAAVRVALDAARRRNLPLVVTSRADGVPPDLDLPSIKLGPLELDVGGATSEVLERLGGRVDDEGRVRQTIESGELVRSPFYLGVVAELLRLRALEDPPEGEHAVRLALLGRWRERIVGGESVPTDERERRERVLQAVSEFAVARLGREPALDAERDDGSARAADPAMAEAEWRDALHAAEALGVVELDEDGFHRFKHEVLHAYFASLVLRDDAQARRDVLAAGAEVPRVQLALVLAAAASSDPKPWGEVCDALLAAARRVSADQRLLCAAAAAEVARAAKLAHRDGAIAAECVAARRQTAPQAKLAALEQIARLGLEHAVAALWEYARDDDYDVRWSAAQRLVDRCGDPHAYDVLAERVTAGLEAAEGLEGARDDWTPEIVPLKHMAWMLPALRTRIAGAGDGDAARSVEGHLERLLDLEQRPVTEQRGLEASIAQGFKADAQLNPAAGFVDADAVALLRRARFWYSQLNLLHAVAVRAAHGAALPRGKRRVSDLLDDVGRDAHPFVEAAAELCDRGVRNARRSGEPRAIDGYVWKDEGRLVSARPGGLVAEAIQLVGDIVVVLNMNENGDEGQRALFGESSDLPHCMSDSVDRGEVFDRCPAGDACAFRLCPYQPAVNRLSAHREISRAFCRHQRHHAKPRTARRWRSRVGRSALREFWWELELRARG